jgi:hypothetical protein
MLEARMIKSLLVGLTLTLAGNPLAAQRPLPRLCLHGEVESAMERARRQQAIDYATKINAAEGMGAIAPRAYRPLEQLNLPPLPAGFTIQLNSDSRTYTFALKDTRDPCAYAIFSDQDRLMYEGVPKTDVGGIVPLGTR